jgi:hypothetical protein
LISPTTANQTYTLPPANEILTEYGFNITTGQANLAVGNQIPLTVINQSAIAGYVLSSPTGGDGSAVIAYGSGVTGPGGSPAGTGTVFGSHATNFYLNVTAVNASTSGVTGTYSIYA